MKTQVLGHVLRVSLALAVSSTVTVSPVAAQSELEPYKMLRSLQYVQDSVVQGDHSAADMQRFLLQTIDARLRAVEPGAFTDPRNADAAMIYAMSGGNPQTLQFLVSRDVEGSFDMRLVDVLEKYFDGRGQLAVKRISDLVPEYRNTTIGPYLALVAGNMWLNAGPKQAIEFFDEVSLGAPGTILEESALRRSMAAALDAKMVDKAMHYASRYVRRFLHSPYSNQFADFFVELVVANGEHVSHDDIGGITDLMDDARAQETYLRISRLATLRGQRELASFAAAQAERLRRKLDGQGYPVLSELYKGIADVATSEVVSAVDRLSEIPDHTLSARDRALKNAARLVADEIVRPPLVNMPKEGADGSVSTRPVIALPPSAKADGETAAANAVDVAGADQSSPVLDFVQQQRARLGELDALLKEEGDFDQ